MSLSMRDGSFHGPRGGHGKSVDSPAASPPASSPAGCYVAGAWSQAGLATLLHVKALGGGLDILFDCGAFVASTRSARHVFISHGHCDHVGAAVQFARATSLNSGPAPAYYVPESCREPLEQAQRAFATLDGSEIPMNLRVLSPPSSAGGESPLTVSPDGSLEGDVSSGSAVALGNGFQAFAFPTMHRVPSQGYCVVRAEKGRLLPQFAHMSPEELQQRRSAGQQITGPSRHTLQLAYTGDTTLSGLLDGSHLTASVVVQVPVLIMEMTYLDGEPDRAAKWGHIHLTEFLQQAHRFRNEHIVFVHISERYQPYTKALSILRAAVPPELQPRISVALRSFGAQEDLTPLLPPRAQYRRMLAEAGVAVSYGRREKSQSHESEQQQQHRPRRRIIGTSPSSSSARSSHFAPPGDAVSWPKPGGSGGGGGGTNAGRGLVHGDKSSDAGDTVLMRSTVSYAAVLGNRGRVQSAHGSSSTKTKPSGTEEVPLAPLCAPCPPPPPKPKPK